VDDAWQPIGPGSRRSLKGITEFARPAIFQRICARLHCCYLTESLGQTSRHPCLQICTLRVGPARNVARPGRYLNGCIVRGIFSRADMLPAGFGSGDLPVRP
jgi:hypothetical protein